MSKCNLCPRNCNVDRKKSIGFCGSSDTIKIAKADLHFWEEPCVSGKSGSGTIFFSGCSLKCAFCQNSFISHNCFGREVSESRFYDILFELKNKGAHNINLVTADHYLTFLAPVIRKAKKDGLDLPIVLNTSSYLKPETVISLSDVIDVYLADFKFFNSQTSKKYCLASDYPVTAMQAIDAMVSTTGENAYCNGIINKGVIIRVLVLPGNVIEAKLILKYLIEKYDNRIPVSIMNQYTPVNNSNFPELNKNLTKLEYKSVVDYAIYHGLTNGFIQESGSDCSKYIPDFDLKGV